MRHATGLSLVELLVGIALMGLLLALALPAFGGIIEHTRGDALAQRIQTELAYARHQAMFRRTQVVMCRTRDFRTCLDAGVWSVGTMTFEDRNRDETMNPGEALLAVMPATAFQGLHLVGSPRRPVIGFRPDGRSAGTNNTLRICGPSLKTLTLLVINTGGRTRLARAGRGTPPCGSDSPVGT
jgi:type IV fimbrial biogenesis protein FimT